MQLHSKMRPSIIKKKLKVGKPTLLTQLHLTDASIFEMVSVMGFDGIWMDLEHHGYSLETAGNLIRATRVGSTDILARAAKGGDGKLLTLRMPAEANIIK